MVTRPRTPHGKRVTLSVKVSEDVAAAVDAARGGQSRSEWLHAAIFTALRRDAGRLAVQAVTRGPVREVPFSSAERQ